MESQTKRLYFEDTYLREFDSRVTARDLHDCKPAVMLAETCFYPESGGQPADRGTLNGIEVLDVVEKNGEIWHVLEHELEAEEVRGIIDWDTRFDHMQQHAGQHVLSQSFYNLVRGETRSFHLGETTSTLEIGISKISDTDLERIELEANFWVFRNGEIKSYFVDEINIAEVPLRRPPKKSGKIRVVEIGGYDFSACGGTHPAYTGEIGLIKI
jgi:alanyl-tRNA synthetase